MEDSSRYSGLKFLAACNGTTAGGGYELALACDEIYLVDDRSAAVSLPEIPLLGVLPGTGGLTRLTDKRRVRRDRADMLCTVAEGVKAPRAKEWRLIDAHAKPQQFASMIRQRALELGEASDRPAGVSGVELTAIERTIEPSGYHYPNVEVLIDGDRRAATLTIHVPNAPQPGDLDAIVSLGAKWWPLALARELDDAILMLRTNNLDIGTWILKSRGAISTVLAYDRLLVEYHGNWFVRETRGMLRRTLARLEVSSRSLFALIEPGSCFAGTLLELALAADRSYMLATEQDDQPRVALSELNFGAYETAARMSRIQARFYGENEAIRPLRERLDTLLTSREALDLGLVSAIPDELDWDDEIRLALEERSSLSPDALSGMEASLRFGPGETLETRIFGRLSAWQNWIFNRPNAVGEAGALKVFGTGHKARFNWERV
jgi:benzoyl-CoA-dihydrodiol lyase